MALRIPVKSWCNLFFLKKYIISTNLAGLNPGKVVASYDVPIKRPRSKNDNNSFLKLARAGDRTQHLWVYLLSHYRWATVASHDYSMFILSSVVTVHLPVYLMSSSPSKLLNTSYESTTIVKQCQYKARPLHSDVIARHCHYKALPFPNFAIVL